MQVFYDKTLINESNYVSKEISEEDCMQLCLEDGNCDAFEYMSTTGICLHFQLQDYIMMEYSFNQLHIGSGQIQNIQILIMIHKLYIERSAVL